MSGLNFGVGVSSFVALIASLGYFVYDGLHGVFGIVILSIVLGITTLIALIPFAGFLVQIVIMYSLAIPWIFEFTGLTGTWLTSVIFWVYAILGFIVTVITTLIVFNSR